MTTQEESKAVAFIAKLLKYGTWYPSAIELDTHELYRDGEGFGGELFDEASAIVSEAKPRKRQKK